jgi:hypothetical protein
MEVRLPNVGLTAGTFGRKGEKGVTCYKKGSMLHPYLVASLDRQYSSIITPLP